jgi:hypothetical protein
VLPLSEDHTTLAFLKALIECLVGDGASTLFWIDPWLNGQCILDMAPGLIAEVPHHCHNRRMVASACQDNAWLQDITGPLTILMLIQYISVQQLVDSFP